MASTLTRPAGGMYPLQPYYKTSEVMDPPECMYKLQRFYTNEQNEAEAAEQNLPPEVKQLEKRQEFILKRLEALRLEVDKLAKSQSIPETSKTNHLSTGATTKQANQQQTFDGLLRDLVISASPSCPPLSLLVLAEQLAEQYRVLATNHVHSSVGDAPVVPELRAAFSSGQGILNRTDFQLVLTVIWKQGQEDTSLMVSPNVQTTIHGEANIARYLSRLMNPAYDGFDILAATEIDGWLDLSTQILHGNNKEKAAGLRTLNARLGKNSWIVGSGLTLADIVIWSALQQNKMTQAVPSNVKKWLEGCNRLNIFQKALQLTQYL